MSLRETPRDRELPLCDVCGERSTGVAEMFTVLCSPHKRSWVQAPTPLHQCLWTHLQVPGSKRLAAKLTSMQLAGVATEVNLRITQAKKHSGDPPFETQGRCHQNRVISGPTKRTSVLQKILKKDQQHSIWSEFLRSLQGMSKFFMNELINFAFVTRRFCSLINPLPKCIVLVIGRER